MRSLRRLTIAIVLILIPLWGCDGRGGSSGFDVNSENATISQALQKRQCLAFQELTICPADGFANETPTAATATPGGTPSVDTPLANATSIDCFQSIPGGSCTFVLRFAPRAFPSNTTFKVLSRAGGSSNPWVLGTDPVPEGGSSSYDATLELTSPQGGPPAQVQLAILAFAGAPASSPTAVQELHQTAATFAFVTQVLTVNVVTPTPLPTPTRRPTGTPTPTSTPGASDCCQCPSSCAVPVGGACDSGCTVVFGTSCFGEQLCVLRTPTPTFTPSLTPTPCFQDTSDGTITDGCTGLMWEKKDQVGGLHDYSALYTWAGACPGTSSLCQPNAAAADACAEQTGGAVGCSQCAIGTCIVDPNHNGVATTIWDWLSQLNAVGLAGYNDWRIPTVSFDGDTPELETILAAPYPCTGLSVPCVSAAFNTDCTPGCTATSCSCTQASGYWSATTNVTEPGDAVEAGFAIGAFADGAPKTDAVAVRAVRGRL
jgi:hypothetical protein